MANCHHEHVVKTPIIVSALALLQQRRGHDFILPCLQLVLICSLSIHVHDANPDDLLVIKVTHSGTGTNKAFADEVRSCLSKSGRGTHGTPSLQKSIRQRFRIPVFITRRLSSLLSTWDRVGEMDNSTSADMSMIGRMTPWLHFGTDYLIFAAWQPSSRGAIAGACVGLFFFCILERCLAAYRRTQELHWRASAILMSDRMDPSARKDDAESSKDVSTHRQLVPPFSPSRDIQRGVIQAVQSTFSFTLMLTIMTFNGVYIISVITGLGVGEVLFGRFGRK